jgi:hypothetical protein
MEFYMHTAYSLLQQLVPYRTFSRITKTMANDNQSTLGRFIFGRHDNGARSVAFSDMRRHATKGKEGSRVTRLLIGLLMMMWYKKALTGGQQQQASGGQ